MIDYNSYNVDPNVYQQQTIGNVMNSVQIKDAREQRRFQNAMAMREERRQQEQNALNNDLRQQQQDRLAQTQDLDTRKTAMQYALRGATPEQQTELFRKAYSGLGGKGDISNFQFTQAGTTSKSQVTLPNGQTMELTVPTQNLMTTMDVLNNKELQQDPQKFGQALNNLGASLQGVAQQQQKPQVAGDPKEAAGIIFGRLPVEQQTAANYKKIYDQVVDQNAAGGSGNTKRFQPYSGSESAYSFDAFTGEYIPATDPRTGKPIKSPSADVELAGSKKEATKKAELEQKKAYSYPDVRNSYNNIRQGWATSLNEIENAINLTGAWTAGAGSLLGSVPYTDSNKLKNSLKMIRSNAMLSALGELKNSSKTGASGMGALSESEGQILEKSLGNLDQSQTANELRRNLLRLKERLLKSSDNLTKAFNADYGEYIAQDNAAPNQQQVSGQMAQPRNATPAQAAPAAGNVDYESMANDYLKSIGIQ